MSQLQPATLRPLFGDAKSPKQGKAVPVQFNPTSLRITLTSQTQSPRTPTGPAAQATGANATLSLDLHFDTADEGTTDAPADVRKKTQQVAVYLTPGIEKGKKSSPPRVRFQWGKFILDGVMTSMTEDLDYFSAEGVPLRAKVSISIEGQNPAHEALATSPGSATGAGATTPGGGAFSAAGGVGLGMSASFGAAVGGQLDLPQLTIGGGLGGGLSVGLGASVSGGFGDVRVGVALDGESPAAFASRMGLDPAAWRALAAPGGVGLSLAAGTEIAFPKGVDSAPGVGTSSGSRAPAGHEALAGVDGPSRPPTSPRDAAATGFALARAGGVGAAVQTVRQERAQTASTQELRAFGQHEAAAGPAPAASSSPRRPLHAPPAPGSASAPAPPPPRADERATSFGQGVPLRPRRAVGAARGVVVLGRRAPTAPAPPPRVSQHAGGCGCGCGGCS